MKTGRHITREFSTINRIEESDIKEYYGKVPSGIVPLVLNIILCILILHICIFVPNEKIKWPDAFVIASYVTFSLNILWLVGRQEFFQDARYNAFSMWKNLLVEKSRKKFTSLQLMLKIIFIIQKITKFFFWKEKLIPQIYSEFHQ